MQVTYSAVGFGGECAKRGELGRVFPRPNPPHGALNTRYGNMCARWPKIRARVLQAREQVSTVLVFVSDNPEEHEKLELRSRTEVRVTEGETEESVIYQFTGKTSRE